MCRKNNKKTTKKFLTCAAVSKTIAETLFPLRSHPELAIFSEIFIVLEFLWWMLWIISYDGYFHSLSLDVDVIHIDGGG